MEAWLEFGIVEVRLVARGRGSKKLDLEEGAISLVFRCGSG